MLLLCNVGFLVYKKWLATFNFDRLFYIVHLIAFHLCQVLLRRFQITRNLSLDGVLDFLNSKKMTDAGPLDLIDDENSDIEEGIDQQTQETLGYDLPGSVPNRGRPIVRTIFLKITPTGISSTC